MKSRQLLSIYHYMLIIFLLSRLFDFRLPIADLRFVISGSFAVFLNRKSPIENRKCPPPILSSLS
jgi:hypothetical protein